MGKHREKARRIVIRALFLLLLGSIINVAIAWGCALIIDPTWPPVIRKGDAPNIGPQDTWTAIYSRAPGIVVVTSHRRVKPSDSPVSPPIDATGNVIIPAWAERLERRELVRVWWKAIANGFPTPSMACEYELPSTRQPPYQVGGGIDIGVDWVQRGVAIQPRGLPLIPIWPQFLFNSLIWAITAGMTCFTWSLLRRMRRLKRDLCPTCAYPIGRSPVCTECGAPIERKT